MIESIQIPQEEQWRFQRWLQRYAAARAELIDQGKFCTLMLIDFENWEDPIEGASRFHYGSVQ